MAPSTNANRNIRKSSEQNSCKVIRSQNIDKAPEDVKNETKKIEDIILKNKHIQNNDILIKIDCETNQNPQKPIQINRNIPIPPPSKVVIKIPSISQLCIINKTKPKVPQKMTSKSLIGIVSNEQDAEKIAKFNNLMLEKFMSETRNQQIQPEIVKSKEEVFSRFKCIKYIYIMNKKE